MIITVIIFALACVTLFVYSLRGCGLNKRAMELDETIATLITKLNRDDGQPVSDENPIENLTNAYNARAELDESVDEFHRSMTFMSVLTVVISILTIIAAL